jgi:glycosyltransferase involved in cell wall biosynthesis
MKVSVIVPAYNEERLISQTLDQLRQAMAAFGEVGWTSEVIVCDNNSTDRTAALASQAGATVVFEPINQISRARNCGAAAASGDWLIFLDADSHPSLGLFHEVISSIQSGACLAGGCTIRLDNESPVGGRCIKAWNWLSRNFRLLAGSFIFCQAEAFRKVGGFNQELFATEELDLTRRLKKLARQTKKQLVIIHRYPLLTSARKFHLYTFREYMSFFAKTVCTGGGTLKNRSACGHWYDGRR